MTRAYHKKLNGQKWCWKCQQYKLLSEFYHNRFMYDGLDNHCKACHRTTYNYSSEYQSQYYLANKERLLPKHRESAKASRISRKQIIT